MSRRIALFFTGVLAVAGGYLLLRTENRAVRSAADFGDGTLGPRPLRRCSGITRGGSRCSRDAEPESEFCWQHG